MKEMAFSSIIESNKPTMTRKPIFLQDNYMFKKTLLWQENLKNVLYFRAGITSSGDAKNLST